MITTVCFDFYNTLYAAHEWFELEVRELPSRFLHALSGQAPPFSPEQEERVRRAYRVVREEVHRSGREVTAEEGLRRACLGAGLPFPEGATKLLDRLQREAYRKGREEPGACECVRSLAAAGYRLGIVSNALHKDFILWSLQDSGLLGCFSGVFASADIGYYKSSPELYRRALDALETEPANAVHVGDSYRFDVLGARAAGIRAVWYSPLRAEPPGMDADATIAHLGQLLEVIEAMDAVGETTQVPFQP